MPGATSRICQLTGDRDALTGAPTKNRTFSRQRVFGTDLGYPVEHRGRLFLMFGDTWTGLRPDGEGEFPPGHDDSLAVLSGDDPDDCLDLTFVSAGARIDAPDAARTTDAARGGAGRADAAPWLPGVFQANARAHDALLRAVPGAGEAPERRPMVADLAGWLFGTSIARAVASYAASSARRGGDATFPSSASASSPFDPMTVTPRRDYGSRPIDGGPFATPVGGVSDGERLHVFFKEQSLANIVWVARSSGHGARFEDARPAFTARFRNLAVLDEGGEDVLLFGRPQFDFVGLPLYLALHTKGDLRRGEFRPRFYRGKAFGVFPWFEAGREVDAVPLTVEAGATPFEAEAISHFSVDYDKVLGRYVMTYATLAFRTESRIDLSPFRVRPFAAWRVDYDAPTLFVRTAEAPWGPWSAPEPLFRATDDGGYCAWMHVPDEDAPALCAARCARGACGLVGNPNDLLLAKLDGSAADGKRPAPASVLNAPTVAAHEAIVPVARSGTPSGPKAPLSPLAQRTAWLYGIQALPRFTKAAASPGASMRYFLVSTANPYQVVLMRTELRVHNAG